MPCFFKSKIEKGDSKMGGFRYKDILSNGILNVGLFFAEHFFE